MGRYTGSKLKLCRKVGQILPGITTAQALKRINRPGQHGAAQKKISEYGKRLLEKQIVRYHYGLKEKQILKVYQKARVGKGVTGETFLNILEKRLDNIVWRGGFARTMPAARQMVGHGHVLVNDKKVDIASYNVKKGDVVTIKEKSRKVQKINDCIVEKLPENAPKFLEVNPNEYSIKVVDEPQKDDVPFDVDVQLIVEYYSR